MTKKIKIPKLPALRNDNYLTCGANSAVIGSFTGVLGTGTLGLNDYLLNGGSHIAIGGATKERIGSRIFFTTLRVRGSVTIPSGNSLGRFRMIVAKGPDAGMAKLTNNTAVTGLVESTAILEPNQNVLTGTILPIDFPLATSSEYKVIYDKVFTAAPATASCVVPIDVTVPLKLVRGYDATGAPTEGSFVLYFCAPSGTTTLFNGCIKASYVSMAAGF